MKKTNVSVHDRIKEVLHLPSDARADDVFECVIGCLTDGLDCQLEQPQRLPGDEPRYQAAWLSRDGTRYTGEGLSNQEAALTAALRLIAEAQEASILRAYEDPEPEVEVFQIPARRIQPKATGAGALRHGAWIASNVRRLRRPGAPE